ncbi:MAG TPA: PQQ-dependent dehydrogenase, methanol/ethanol family [Vicinamibacterales bacterium]|nr:PQQ-dependent dehydrogenase, methanol/ethanol family [Vicinamibacterales bacterium]
MNLSKKLAAVAVAVAAPLVSAQTVVDDKALADESQGANWLSYGRTYSEQRFSPLMQIDTKNVGKLALEWQLPLPNDTSLLATPLVVDSVMYFTGTWNVTRAVDARTGKLLWEYDPKVIEHSGDRLRIYWGTSRGLGYWKGSVVIATTDGRVIALDAKEGKEKWSVQSTDVKSHYYISGYPKIFHGKVLVGNGGTEHGAARGYVTAYDIETGKQAWRFYIVPGNPVNGFEDEAQEMAAKTWTGEWWKHGGGGNTWNGFTYDAEFNQILIGTGNGSPWNRKVRSPGGGDNLFLCSIVALDASSGKYKWHYQTTPGETWDYNSSMDIVLADLKIKGTTVKALMHAPKNGFFYVIDRSDGKLISADKIAKVTWASHIDLKTGRPVEMEGVRYEDGPSIVWPSAFGAHNWHAMSFNPRLGLMFVPKVEMPGKYDDSKNQLIDWQSPKTSFDPAVDAGFGSDIPKGSGISALIAFDPLKGKKVWEVPLDGFWNPGTMATAGDLVFQGRANGTFAAYDAKTGKELWSRFLGLGISAPPITYSVDGKQYVSILVGWGGAAISIAGGSANAQYGWAYRAQTRRLYTFSLDGKAAMPTFEPQVFPKPIIPTNFTLEPERVAKGQEVYVSHCLMCHGAGVVSGGGAPDLRASPIPLGHDALKAVVVKGALRSRGMPQFAEITDDELDSLRHFIRSQAIATADGLKEVEKPNSGPAPKASPAKGAEG